MKILLITKSRESLTGAGTYEATLVKELSKRHQVKVLSPGDDLGGEWDIAHCTDLKHLSFAVAKNLRCPLVVDAHDYYWIKYYHFFSLDFPLRFLVQKYRKIKYHFLFRHIDGMILHGEFLYNLYRHPRKYLSFYFGLDFSGIEPKAWDKRENLILFIGGDFFRKGLPRLLRALPLVIQKVPDVRVMVIGNDYWYARAFARWLSRGLPVEFVYGMPRRDVYRNYSRGKVLVLPSEIEATPLVIAEATVAGVTPIASAVGGHPELIQDGKSGYIFPLGDTRILADRIVACLSDRQLSEHLVKNGREFFNTFTIERMIDRLDDIYTDVITSSSKKKI